uniref:KIB1-4 beta-propeller domain-containing protein n=1 Tax=Aegilops tauschii TaxID=37682 RepID=M8AQZ1_AEGTA
MAASGGSCGGCAWPDLQPEMLGVVLSRVPSHADRVRLAAVCRPWRSTARLLRPLPRARRRQALAGELLPPLLPWLALCDGTFLSLPDGAVHRLPVADDASSRVSTGSALFLVHGDGRCCLMNPSPVTTSPVPEAADWFRENPTVRKALDTMRCSTTEWAAPEDSCVSDIALFKGKLYVLLDTQDGEYGQQHELRVLDDGREQTAIPGTRIHGHESFNAYATDMYVQRNYLVVSGDRLLMVERRIYQPPMLPVDSGIEKRTRLFKVFEATDLSIGRGLWTEVDTLMGRALFVSGGCSQSLPAGGQSSGVGAREDCIYFVNEDHADTDISDFEEEICENPFLDSGVYNMGDHTMTPLPSEAVAAPAAGDGPWSPTWLFPET